MIRILFVCMGNICRSPAAHGVFRSMVEARGLGHRFEIDSAGTHAYHAGEAPDPRGAKAAKSRGVDISDLRARAVDESDFRDFDYVVAMDSENIDNLERIQPADGTAKVFRLMSLISGIDDADVPDPYYGGSKGFERVLDLVEQGCARLLDKVLEDRS